MEILIPVLVLCAIALLLAVILVVASVFFGVQEDSRAAELRDRLRELGN